jgi:hypothetical protein
MTTSNKLSDLAQHLPEREMFEARKTKPRNHKLTPEQLTEQVIALETKDMQAVASAITAEIESRKAKHQKALAELEGK